MSINIFKLLCVSVLASSLACNTVTSTSSYNQETPLPATASEAQASPAKDKQIAVFAGGCFWGVEAVFENIKGVSDVKSGYSGGAAKTANYDAIGSGTTGHAEAVQITYDPAKISYEQLLDVFFKVAHDPTELNRQGPDIGSQYRSAIFYTNDAQKASAQKMIETLGAAKAYPKPIVTQLTALEKFYDAEAYHQDYLPQNLDSPYIIAHDLPKLENLKKQFPALFVKK